MFRIPAIAEAASNRYRHSFRSGGEIDVTMITGTAKNAGDSEIRHNHPKNQMKGTPVVLPVLIIGIGAQILLLAGATIYVQSNPSKSSKTAKAVNETGFVKAAPPKGAIANEVLIVGPNCNRPEGVRTRALANELARLNIPYRQTDTMTFSADDGLGNLWQMHQLLQKEGPLVFVNRKAKANPALNEVVTEYQFSTKVKVNWEDILEDWEEKLSR